ncbi:MAG: PfkB family carbohydrate kinase [Candidatus Aminicenantes bacterium]|nr:PfkB family carbohydrate kinase [Candidatus Aminicenantes bacterium]
MQSTLRSIVSRFKNKKIAVWGDLILDEYVFTSAGRVSREAPVLVTEFEANEYLLGGAGNVVMNLLTLGAQPLPVGLIGKDAAGDKLRGLLVKKGISTDHLVSVDRFRTPLKSRILAGGDNTKKQQILRIDTLPPDNIGEESYRELVKALWAVVRDCDLLILSDYLGKTVTPAIFKTLRKESPDTISAVDSRSHLLDFSGVNLATPNEPEIKSIFPQRRFLADDDFIQAGSELLDKLGADGIVLKRGQKGMQVFSRGQKANVLDIHGTAQIVDVTGAGDTVLAVLGLGLAAGATLLDAARLANIAGGIVVMHEGAYPVRLQELLDALP